VFTRRINIEEVYQLALFQVEEQRLPSGTLAHQVEPARVLEQRSPRALQDADLVRVPHHEADGGCVWDHGWVGENHLGKLLMEVRQELRD
jgi:hypothetical protein